jgi:Ca-activated chloride channel family protein
MLLNIRSILLRLPAAFSLAIIVALVLAARVQGQTPTAEPQQERSTPTRPQLDSDSPKEETADKSKGYTIGVNVDLVVVHTSIYDKNNHFISGLTKNDFRIFEDGVEQDMTSFSQEDVPISLGILLDLSGSMRGKIEDVNKAALAFIQASNPQDQVFLIGFNDEVELLQDFSSDIDEISDSLENIVVTGGTALFDAIYLGVQKAHAGTDPKKAVVVITDGEDRDSYYAMDELLAKVQESDVQVYSIGFLNEVPETSLFGRWSKTVPEKAHDALERIADETGGKAFFPKQISEINRIVAEIAAELRNQYSLGYISSNALRDGSWRRLKIELKPAKAIGARLRFRRGYYAPKSLSQK